MTNSPTDKIHKTFNALLSPINTCNLRCEYCYRDGKGIHLPRKKIMGRETLEKIIKELSSFFDDGVLVNYIWHGAEPLSVGEIFYHEVVEIQNKYSKNFKNSIQSNLTLLTKSFYSFLKNNDFKLSTSLDGPSDIHNLTRRFKNGKGSFSRVSKSIELIKSKGDNIGAVMVLNQKNINHLVESYYHFKNKEIDLKPIPIVLPYDSPLSITPEEYSRAMINLFDGWFYDDQEPFVVNNFFYNIIRGILKNEPAAECTFSGTCRDSFIYINPEGDVFPCCRFEGYQNFHLGNINSCSLEDIFSSDKYQRLSSRTVESLDDCRDCDYEDLCKGGCPEFSYILAGDYMNKDPFCEGYKMLFGHIKKVVEEELKDAEVPKSK